MTVISPMLPDVFEILLHHAADAEDNCVKRGEHAQRRQRVGVAAPENDIDVHQPVTHDGVGDRERNQRSVTTA